MKTLLIAGLVLLVLVDIWLANLAFSMVSQASTAAVFGGIGLLVAIVGITGLAFGYTGRLFPTPQPRWRKDGQHLAAKPRQPTPYPAGTAFLRLVWSDDTNERLSLRYRSTIVVDGTPYDSVEECLRAIGRDGTTVGNESNTNTAPDASVSANTAHIAALVGILRQRLLQDSLFAAELHALSTLGSYRVMYVDDDPFWGCTADGRGANVYGQVLQDLAQEYVQRRS